MCLIKGKEYMSCDHLTCKRLNLRPELFETSNKAIFDNRQDFNKVKLSRTAENKPNHLKVSNPHKQNSGNWREFERFRILCNNIKAMGDWPNGTLFEKSDIDIQFFLYARRVGTYNPLKQEYDFTIQMDVQEGAVYCWPKDVE